MAPGRSHVVARAALSEASVENAFVETLPTKLWSCESPGFPGNTIGSSGARWLKRQVLTKLTSRKSAMRAWALVGSGFPSSARAPAATRASPAPTKAAATTLERKRAFIGTTSGFADDAPDQTAPAKEARIARG